VPEISHGEPYSNTSYAKVLSSGDASENHSSQNVGSPHIFKSIANENALLPSSQEPYEEPSVLTNLPYLNVQDKMILAAGGMIQKQYRDGYRGSGYVVVDIKCSPNVVFDTLTQIAMYENMIPIVKSSKIISSDGISTVAEFALSKFLLRANVKHSVLPDQRLLKFSLDENQINLVVKEADGFWHVQVPTDRPAGYCRVYLSAQVLTDTMVPPLILDYAVSRALSRATKWLKPFFSERMNE
jgi:ribosome-associated toxin RatA of RatAB toxin-antitoxin module